MYIQWWLTETTLLDRGAMYSHFKLLRSQDGGKFVEIADYGPHSPPRATWFIIDSTVINGSTYRYVLHAVFAIFEDPEAEGFSDTLVVTPQTGLADPRPQAPDSIWHELLVEDSVTIVWISPEGNDEIYYLLWTPAADSLYIYEENFDNAGHDWSPGEDDMHPAELDTSSFTFIHARNGDIAFYQVYCFVDSVISYPSGLLEIEHTWQP